MSIVGTVCAKTKKVIFKEKRTMKKALSILLIIAAIFGFYGGAVNLKDVLDCKAYWEEEGRKTDENLDKLEDGINQLSENEQAYLNGKDQVADGEAQLAAGRKELAQGEADFAAAPAKLEAGQKALDEGYAAYAAGEADLAAGREQVADGENSLAALRTLIAGLKKINAGAEGQWLPGFEAPGTQEKGYTDGGLRAARNVITQSLDAKKDQIALIGSMIGSTELGANIKPEASYADFDADVKDLIKAFGQVAPILSGFAGTASGIAENTDLAGVATKLSGDDAKEYTLTSISETQSQILTALGVTTAADLEALEKMLEAKEVKTPEDMQALAYINNYKQLQSMVDGRATVQSQIAAQAGGLGDKLDLVKGLSVDLYNTIAGAIGTLTTNDDAVTNGEFATAIATLQSAMGTLSTTLSGLATELDSNAALLTQWDAGYQQLADGQKELADGVKEAYSGMLGNSTIKQALDEAGITAAIKFYANAGLDKADPEEFDTYLGKGLPLMKLPSIVDINKGLIVALGQTYADGAADLEAGKKQVADGEKQLAAARKQLAAGEKELAAGKADYAAAPAKLAAGREELAAGIAALNDGKAQLAEYEDGEQQVRDGLATLFNTEANGGLKSIADRIGGDGNFDDANGHLKLAEGLKGVTEGRNYSADSGVLITKEVLTRGIGTACGLAAALFALIAAILCFAKKHKGAGVFAVLTGLCGVAGIAVAKSAGTEFSGLAGSPLSPVPYIAFAILAVVALAAAFANFGAKKDA